MAGGSRFKVQGSVQGLIKCPRFKVQG